MTLDNRLFLLQHTKGLTPEMRAKLFLADKAFLQNRDGEAINLVSEVEKECQFCGIPIFSFDFPFAV